MSKDAKNVPALRFKGYSDAWEKRKLKELGDTYSGLSGKTKEDFGHGEARYVTYMNVFTNPVADPVGTETTEIDTRQNEVKKNDVFFTTSSETPGEVGMSSVWPIETKNVYLNSFCFGYRILNQSSLNFLFIAQQMRSPSFRKRIIVLAQGISRYNISKKKVLEIPIFKPSLNEQNKIGHFLSNVDVLIAATQHKIDALEQVKKALLQRLFDQSWRFDGYLETWKKYRLGDHAEILTGGTPKTSVAEYWEPKSIPWMSSGEVNKVYLDQTDTMISLEGFKNSSARWVKKHSILIALAGQGKTRGTVAVNNIALTTNQSIAAIIPGKDLYYEFVFQNLTNRYNELRLISSGDGTRGGLNKQIVSDVTIHSPNLNEQIRIGKLLSKVDHLSTENQLKLSRIELIKKYLLQTLFI